MRFFMNYGKKIILVCILLLIYSPNRLIAQEEATAPPRQQKITKLLSSTEIIQIREDINLKASPNTNDQNIVGRLYKNEIREFYKSFGTKLAWRCIDINGKDGWFLLNEMNGLKINATLNNNLKDKIKILRENEQTYLEFNSVNNIEKFELIFIKNDSNSFSETLALSSTKNKLQIKTSVFDYEYILINSLTSNYISIRIPLSDFKNIFKSEIGKEVKYETTNCVNDTSLRCYKINLVIDGIVDLKSGQQFGLVIPRSDENILPIGIDTVNNHINYEFYCPDTTLSYFDNSMNFFLKSGNFYKAHMAVFDIPIPLIFKICAAIIGIIIIVSLILFFFRRRRSTRNDVVRIQSSIKELMKIKSAFIKKPDKQIKQIPAIEDFIKRIQWVFQKNFLDKNNKHKLVQSIYDLHTELKLFANLFSESFKDNEMEKQQETKKIVQGFEHAAKQLSTILFELIKKTYSLSPDKLEELKSKYVEQLSYIQTELETDESALEKYPSVEKLQELIATVKEYDKVLKDERFRHLEIKLVRDLNDIKKSQIKFTNDHNSDKEKYTEYLRKLHSDIVGSKKLIESNKSDIGLFQNKVENLQEEKQLKDLIEKLEKELKEKEIQWNEIEKTKRNYEPNANELKSQLKFRDAKIKEFEEVVSSFEEYEKLRIEERFIKITDVNIETLSKYEKKIDHILYLLNSIFQNISKIWQRVELPSEVPRFRLNIFYEYSRCLQEMKRYSSLYKSVFLRDTLKIQGKEINFSEFMNSFIESFKNDAVIGNLDYLLIGAQKIYNLSTKGYSEKILESIKVNQTNISTYDSDLKDAITDLIGIEPQNIKLFENISSFTKVCEATRDKLISETYKNLNLKAGTIIDVFKWSYKDIQENKLLNKALVFISE